MMKKECSEIKKNHIEFDKIACKLLPVLASQTNYGKGLYLLLKALSNLKMKD